MRTALFLILTSGFFTAVSGSDSLKRNQRLGYSLALHTGSLFGEQQATTAVGLTHWFSWHRLARTQTGFGVSWENYVGWQTVPFSFQLRYDIGNRWRNPWFLHAACGYSWARLVPDRRPPAFQSDYGGQAYSLSFGKALRYEKIELSWRLGYQVQRVGWEEAFEFEQWFTPAGAETYTNRTEIEMTLRRVTLTMAVRWLNK